MVNCSPRDVVAMDGVRQACLLRRYTCQPPQVIPPSAITHVDGSGTAIGAARRTQRWLPLIDGSNVRLMRDDKPD